MTQQNKVTRVEKEKDIDYKTKQFKSLEKSLSELSSDMTTSKDELKAILDYWKKVTERCVDKREKFAERKARRKAEIKGLMEAKAMLEGTNAPVSMLSRRTTHL